MKRLGLKACLLLFTASCAHNSSETWENMKTAGRYVQKGVDTILGKDFESRLLSSEDEFYGPFDDDFIPLEDADLRNQFADSAVPQPKASPGQFGIPSLDHFYAAPDALKGVFSAVHFNTDEHVIRDRNEVASLMQLAEYMKSHSNVYVAIEGHCDERASASYNIALGMRRANAVRTFLAKQGVDVNRMYTLSKGKEQPIALGHSTDDWKRNRRSEFRIFQK